MLYELYKIFYFNFYDNLIIWLLHFSLIIIFKFIKIFFFKCALHFNQAHACALRFAPRPQEVFALKCALRFTNTRVLVMTNFAGSQQ